MVFIQFFGQVNLYLGIYLKFKSFEMRYVTTQFVLGMSNNVLIILTIYYAV